jgi:hypothetical protein
MKYLLLTLIMLVALSPGLVFGACLQDGYTVVYVNGILNKQSDADKDKNNLRDAFVILTNRKDVNFVTAYNPSHLAGLGDVTQATFQLFGSTVSNFDRDTILRQIQPQIKTRKLLLVGHSQGSFYTNAMYEYLLAHGEPRESVGVYNVASPATFTAGGGKYLTFAQDALIGTLAEAAQKAGGPQPLPPNMQAILPKSEFDELFPGHSFSNAYLAAAPTRVLSDVSDSLAILVPTYSSESGDCFSPPDPTLSYRAQQVVLAVTDPVAQGLRFGAVIAYKGTALALNTAATLVRGGYAAAQTAFSVFASTPEAVDPAPKNEFGVVKSLYGSSLNTEDAAELAGLQPAAVAAIPAPKTNQTTTPPPVVRETRTPLQEVVLPTLEPVVESTSSPPATTVASTTQAPLPVFVGSAAVGGTSVPPKEEIFVEPPPIATSTEDTVATSTEEVIIAPIFFTASTTPPTLSIRECNYSLSPHFCVSAAAEVFASWDIVEGAQTYELFVNAVSTGVTTATSSAILLSDHATSTVFVVARDASSTEAVSLEKSVFVFTKPVVINEVGWAGLSHSPESQWLELKNRTPFVIDLARVGIAVTEGGTQYIPLSGTVTGSEPTDISFGHYLIERGGPLFPLGGGVLRTTFEVLPASGAQLTLVHNNGRATTTFDETPSVATCGGWCAGASFGVVSENGYQNTLSMERIDTDTSGLLASNWASNDLYTPSEDINRGYVGGSPGLRNSFHDPDVGFFCTPDVQSIVQDATYYPKSPRLCYFESRFLGVGPLRFAGIYAGDIGSSTSIGSVGHLSYPGIGEIPVDYTFVPSFDAYPPGTHFFVAIWETRTSVPSPQDAENFEMYFTTGAQNNGTATPPHENYKVIPFVLGSP